MPGVLLRGSNLLKPTEHKIFRNFIEVPAMNGSDSPGIYQCLDGY